MEKEITFKYFKATAHTRSLLATMFLEATRFSNRTTETGSLSEAFKSSLSTSTNSNVVTHRHDLCQFPGCIHRCPWIVITKQKTTFGAIPYQNKMINES